MRIMLVIGLLKTHGVNHGDLTDLLILPSDKDNFTSMNSLLELHLKLSLQKMKLKLQNLYKLTKKLMRPKLKKSTLIEPT